MTDQSKDAFQAEEQRQVNILSKAIKTVIVETGTQFDVPMLNAVFGALAANVAEALVSVPEASQRKQIRNAMDRNVSIILAQALSQPHHTAQTIVIGGVRQ